MDYLSYESFIHPDVLTTFLVKGEDVIFTVLNDCAIGVDTIPVENVANIYSGDKFLYTDVEYIVRATDTIRNNIVITPLEHEIKANTQLKIIKEDRRGVLKNFYNIGERDYGALASTLASAGVPIRFDSDVYILKVAFIAMYKWILQNKSFLKDINLAGVGIPKSQIYDHFFKLLQQEQDELEGLRKEALDELARKQQNDADGKSGKGFYMNSAPNRSFFTGYRRGWR